MSDTTPFEGRAAAESGDATREANDLAQRTLERGRDQIESAKSRVADQAEQIADAVESTANELDSNGDGTVSGYGRSLASMMRQLAGGLREHDVETFARELAGFARRNPGAFLAGSVALGFGLSRFMKASGRESYADFGDDLDTQPGFDNGLEADDDDETIADDLAAFRASPSSQDASSPTRPGELP